MDSYQSPHLYQYFMDSHHQPHTPQKFDPRLKFYWPTLPTPPTNPRNHVTHATHKPMLPIAPTLFSRFTVAYSDLTTPGYYRWPISNALMIKSYSGHGKYNSKLTWYFQMCQCHLSYAMLCTTIVLGISWYHLNYRNLLVRSTYQFHVYFSCTIDIVSFRNLRRNIYGIICPMRMVLAMLEIVLLKVRITVFMMVRVQVQMK